MADLRVQFHGPLTVLRNGVAVQLRTRQQGLLLARLLAHWPSSIGRAETATLLWPSADRPNALAYLRRAVKELRDFGIAIDSDGDGVRLAQEMRSDIAGPQRADGGIRLFGETGQVLQGVEHPVADEIRALIRSRAGTVPGGRLRLPAQFKGDERMVLGWFGDRLLQERPDVARSFVCENWDEFRIGNPPEVVLGILLRLLKTVPEMTPERVRLLAHAGQTAVLVTRRSLAERLLVEALEGSEAQGDHTMSSLVLSGLTNLMLDIRQWERGRGYGRRAIEAAERSGDPFQRMTAYHNLASIQWHTLDFDGAVENYRIAETLAAETTAKVSRTLLAKANMALLWAIYGVHVEPEVEPFDRSQFPYGYGGGVEGYLQFATGFGFGDLALAAEGALRLLDVTSQEHMEWFFAMALDASAFLFGRLDMPAEAAACVRVGTWLRRQTLHRRTPAERLAVRSHVRPPFFGPRIERLVSEWKADDLDRIGQSVAARIRAA